MTTENLINLVVLIGFAILNTYLLNIKRQNNDAEQDALGIKEIKAKLEKYDDLLLKYESLQKDSESQKKKFDEQILNNMALARTIEDQSRKITQLQVDFQRLNSDHDLVKNENSDLNKRNAELSLALSVAHNDRDLALARLEGAMSVIGKINVSIDKIEVKQKGE